MLCLHVNLCLPPLKQGGRNGGNAHGPTGSWRQDRAPHRKWPPCSPPQRSKETSGAPLNHPAAARQVPCRTILPPTTTQQLWHTQTKPLPQHLGTRLRLQMGPPCPHLETCGAGPCSHHSGASPSAAPHTTERQFTARVASIHDQLKICRARTVATDQRDHVVFLARAIRLFRARRSPRTMRRRKRDNTQGSTNPRVAWVPYNAAPRTRSGRDRAATTTRLIGRGVCDTHARKTATALNTKLGHDREYATTIHSTCIHNGRRNRNARMIQYTGCLIRQKLSGGSSN